MRAKARLPFRFDAGGLRADADRMAPGDWVPHFNTAYYEGEWSGVALRSVGGKAGELYPDPTARAEFADTPLLDRAPNVRAGLATLRCPLLAVRFLRLGPGSRIREHRDHRLAFTDGEVRIHVPVSTGPEVTFLLDGEPVPMAEGEAWYLDLNRRHSVVNDGTSHGSIWSFSGPVTGFTGSDVSFTGSTAPGTLVANVTGGPTTYTVSVSGMTGSGIVRASIPANATTEFNAASTSTDNSVTYDVAAPTVTINQAGGQADPTSTSPINFTASFSETVTGFDGTDISFAGSTAGGTLVANVTGTGPTYNVAVSGMTTSGDVVVSIPGARAADLAGNPNAASTSTDNRVTYDATAPSVTINQAGGQGDPTATSPINFTASFSETVTGFDGTDISFAGSTAGGTLVANVTGAGPTYNVAVSGMTTSGDVVVSVPAGAAADLAGNPNAASTSTDNRVSWVQDTTPPTCAITALIAGPPKKMQVTVQDTGSGLQGITNIQITNGTVSTDPSPIPVGTNSPVIVTATKTDQQQPTVWSFDAVDVAGNVKHCDPIDVDLSRSAGKPLVITLSNQPGAADLLTVFNASPGITTLRIDVNGQPAGTLHLVDGERRTVRIGANLQPGNENTVVLTATGRREGSATVLIHN